MFTDAGSNIITSKILPHVPAAALNILRNEDEGNDKSYYSQPSHLEAGGETNLSLDVLGGGRASSPKKSLGAEDTANVARQGWEKIGTSICQGVHRRGQRRRTAINGRE